MTVKERKYTDGEKTFVEIEIVNDAGVKISLSNCGAGIRDVYVPDKDGVPRLVTLRPCDDRLMTLAAHGKTIGRTAGRISGATFTIDGRTAVLEKNSFGVDNRHGGAAGFRYNAFDYAIEQSADGVVVAFTYDSPDGEGGYFGNVTLTVTYTVFARKNAFTIRYDGVTDIKTLLNITNHAYWNLSGDLRETVENHVLFLDSSRVGYVNERGVTVEKREVTPAFDFRRAHSIGEYINAPEVQRVAGGYDHAFFLDGNSEISVGAYSPLSGIKLDIVTDYPCVVVYTNNSTNGAELVGGAADGKYMAVCLECQYHPDGIHCEPDNCGVFSPDEPYRKEIEYVFGIE